MENYATRVSLMSKLFSLNFFNEKMGPFTFRQVVTQKLFLQDISLKHCRRHVFSIRLREIC